MKHCTIALCGLVLLGLAWTAPAHAAVTYNLSFTTTEGSFTPNATFGSFTLDAAPGSSGTQVYTVDGSAGSRLLTLDVSVEGTPFTAADDPNGPSVTFTNGLFTSAAFSFENETKLFSVDSDGFYLSYVDTEDYAQGTVGAQAAVVPLPAALPLAASAFASLGGLGWLKRRAKGAAAAA